MKGINNEDREKFLSIIIFSSTKDKIHIKLPMEFAKKIIKNDSLDFFNDEEDIINSKKLTELVVSALNYDLEGEVAYLETRRGDTIKVIIE